MMTQQSALHLAPERFGTSVWRHFVQCASIEEGDDMPPVDTQVALVLPADQYLIDAHP